MSGGDDLPKDLNKLKVVDLKDELDKRGLPIDGLKKDLIDRLKRALDPELAGNAEMPTDAQKALAEPLKKKEDSPINPTLGEGIQKEALDSAADVTMMGQADKPSSAEHAPDGAAAVETEAEAQTVGHSMVEGPSEAAQEIDDAANARVTQDDVDMMPAALDDEVAAIVAKEEVKATLPPTPSPPPRASPLPFTPPLPEGRSRSPSIGAGNGKKRSASRSVSPEKRRRLASPDRKDGTDDSYPAGPTAVLYVTELRRPLMLPSLHEHLFTGSTPACSAASSPFPASSSRPFTDPDCPGVWLGPIKDHAFAAYASSTAAADAKVRIEGHVWPADTGAALRVRYMPEQAVERVVTMEQAAWKAGRQRLSVSILGDVDDEDRVRVEVLNQKGEPYVLPPAPIDAPSGPKGRQPFTPLQALGRAQGGVGMPRPPQRGVPRGAAPAGAMGVGAGRGFGGSVGPHGLNMNIRGRGGASIGGGDSYVPARDGANPPPAAREPALSGGVGRLVNQAKRTWTRPELVWREGPGATDRA